MGIGFSLLTPTQPFVLHVRANHNSSIYKSKSVHSSRHFAVFVWRGFVENEVERTGEADISRLETLAAGKA